MRMNIKTPAELNNILCSRIEGQDQAKRIMSVAIYNHCLRCNNLDKEIEKSNILMVGPTGVGKTHIAKTLARELNLPIAIADATALTQAGYVGEDVENCLLRLIQAADGDVELAERGIIFIDEIDKLSRKQESPSITRDVSGEGVQQALLKIIEGSVVNVPESGGRKRPDGQGYIQIDTSNILFICSGAFDGIDYQNINVQTLTRYGMMPELLGRLHVIAQLNQLDTRQLRRILTQPKNCIVEQYTKLFALSGCTLNISDGALDVIASVAADSGTGARGLRGILETVLLEYMFDLPGQSTIDIFERDVVRQLTNSPYRCYIESKMQASNQPGNTLGLGIW